MLQRLLFLFGFFLCVIPTHVLGAENMSFGGWEPQKGDIFVVDVPKNMGYLIHEDGSAFPFPVATGRKEFVHYIGRYYHAGTPLRTWTAKQRQTTNDRYTFGDSRRFLRLFYNGGSTSYGIHSYYKVDEWMQEDERFFSMGCVVVTEEILDVIEKTFNLNNKSLTVITTDNVKAEMLKRIASVMEVK